MVETKDKAVTVESLAALHGHNKRNYVLKTDVTPIDKGGTGATNGVTGLKNLFAAGATVISSHQYGNTLPPAGNVGRIFFKKVVG